MRVLLSARGLKIAFGGVKAAEGIDLDVEEGEFLAIIGPNGAGKTTFINMTTGYLKPTAGTITYDGHAVLGMAPRRLVALGIARSFPACRGSRSVLSAEGVTVSIAGAAVLPYQGLAPALALRTGEALARLKDVLPDVALLVTESSPDLLRPLVDRTLVIERGEIAAGAAHA